MNAFGSNANGDNGREDLIDENLDGSQADEPSYEEEDDVSTDEWGNSLDGSIDSAEEEEIGNGGAESGQLDQHNPTGGSGSVPGQFKEYSRDRRRERRPDGHEASNDAKPADGGSRTVRVFGWSEDGSSENETAEDGRSEANLQGTIEAIRYLKESEAVFERLFELADGESFALLIRRLTDQLPKLRCKNSRAELADGEKICYTRLLYGDNAVCLNTVFGDSFELCARRLFFTLKLQFAKK